MKFVETWLAGAFIIDIEPLEDERGFFARSWCADEFRTHGLSCSFVQCNISYNRKAGTLRGMHLQDKPHEEDKLVRCTKGTIYDVIVDLRPESMTAYQWFAVELTATNRRMVYVPAGFAHGFVTLHDDTEVFYQMSEYYHPEYARGFLWNDPYYNIKWPVANPIVSRRDSSYPLLETAQRI